MKTAKPKSIPTPKSAMRLRVELGRQQARKAATWLYVCHDFRQAGVAFITTRRRARGKWIAQHPALARGWLPEEYAGSDSAACSKWLTEQLEAARKAVAREFNLKGGKQNLTSAFVSCWAHLSQGERDEVRRHFEALGTHILWLLVPRTILDQTIQDLNKTTKNALADRKGNRLRKAQGLKPLKSAGFPKHQKWQYATSMRFQISSEKNKDYRESWERKELVIPGLGRLPVQESGYSWPETPAKLITLARNAAGHWHISFACAPGEALSSRGRRLASQGKSFEDLPLDENGLPAVEGLDMSLLDKAHSSVHGKLGRTRHLKRYESDLRFHNKSLARKRKGSGRWKRAVRNLGKIHVKVANARQQENRSHAQAVAKRSAIVCVETLLLAFMQKNKRLAQSIADLGWGQFLSELKSAMDARGHLLLFAGAFTPTTQTCPDCGFINRDLKNNLSIRQWDCPQCFTHHDRDEAAAINIQEDAIRLFLEFSTRAESSLGMSGLHPELQAFITRGGMTALLRPHRSESRQAQKSLGLEVPEKRESSSPRKTASGTQA